jgi:hypothetical protein
VGQGDQVGHVGQGDQTGQVHHGVNLVDQKDRGRSGPDRDRSGLRDKQSMLTSRSVAINYLATTSVL